MFKSSFAKAWLLLVCAALALVAVNTPIAQAQSGADLSITLSATPNPVAIGGDITYTVTLTNNGPEAATNVLWQDIIPLETGYRSLSAPSGWSCTTPSIDGNGTVSCSRASFAASASAVFTVVVRVKSTVLGGTPITNSVITVADPNNDPDESNNTAQTTITVNNTANLGIQMTAAPDRPISGDELTYSITVSNVGPDAGTDVTLSTSAPTNTGFVSLTAPIGWNCTTPSVGASGAVSCTRELFEVGTANFTLVTQILPGVPNDTLITNTASVSGTSIDLVPANNTTGNVETIVRSVADLAMSLSASPDPILGGGVLTYLINLVNNGPDRAADVVWTFTIPETTTYRSLNAPAGWACQTPSVGGTGDVVCARQNIPSDADLLFILTVRVDVNAVGGSTISNQVSVQTTSLDPVLGNNTSNVASVTVATPIMLTDPELPTTLTFTANLGDVSSASFDVANIGQVGTTLVLSLESSTNSAIIVDGLPLAVVEGDPAETFSLGCTHAKAPIIGTVTLRTNELGQPTYTIAVTCKMPPDTIGIRRPSNATFYLRNSNTTGVSDIDILFGDPSDLPVAGDWNGDGISTVGLYRQSTGEFFLKDENSFGAPVVYSFVLGNPGDVPMVGDWDGDGKDSVGVFRPSNGIVYLKNALTTGFADFGMVFGNPNDQPVAGDWNGDGKDSIGIYRGDTFFLTNQTCNGCVPTADYIFILGVTGDVPFSGDWNADGINGVGVFRPTNGITYFKNALETGFADIEIIYGVAADNPIAGRWAPITPPPAAPEVAPTFVPRQ